MFDGLTMSPIRQRLELMWVGKHVVPRLEPRIFIETTELSHGPEAERSNRLILGDNLLALKALEAEAAGQVKCAFIDPPYNSGSAFEHYDDGLEHSIWLGLMRDRLVCLRRLLSEDGSLWISIDDHEAHYLKVVCDEIFGRANFVGNIVWQKRTSPDARLKLGGAHDHILVYARNKDRLDFNRLPLSPEQTKGYKNPDADPRGPWAASDFTAQGWRPNQMYRIEAPSGGGIFDPPPGRCWANVEPVFRQLLADNRIWFGAKGRSRPRVKTFLEEREGASAWSWWDHRDVGHNQEAKKESIALFGAENAFATPKPERLIRRVLEIATKPGDLVLDSFAGSGTTGAVAHKMGRRWIMVERGEHCQSHILPRMRRVVDGSDDGGITQDLGWRGGGGFRYQRLAPSLIRTDVHGRPVIAEGFVDERLAEAVCRIEGYTYRPSETVHWQQGEAAAGSYIFVTDRTLDAGWLTSLDEEVGPDRSLLVLCRAFARPDLGWKNIVVRKLTEGYLDRCDWGRSNYDL